MLGVIMQHHPLAFVDSSPSTADDNAFEFVHAVTREDDSIRRDGEGRFAH